MPEPKEIISLYRQGYAYMGKRPDGHIVNEYDIALDETVDGVRTIVLKERDLKPLLDKVRTLADTIADKMGEGQSKVVKEILFDVLKAYEDKEIDRLYRHVVELDESVKPREGCYKVIVGDGRRKNSFHIMLRD